MRDVPEGEQLFFDFSDITMLAPSWCDEFFGEAVEKYPGRIILDESLISGIRESFKAVEDARGISFEYGSYVGEDA